MSAPEVVAAPAEVVQIAGGQAPVEVVAVEAPIEGGRKTPCKSYQRRSKKTGHCRGQKKTRSRRSRSMKGGETDAIEGGLKRCKTYQRRSRKTGHCRGQKKTRSRRSRSMKGGEVDAVEAQIEGGAVAVEGGAVAVEGGKKRTRRTRSRKACKKSQRRSQKTHRCRSVKA